MVEEPAGAFLCALKAHRTKSVKEIRFPTREDIFTQTCVFVGLSFVQKEFPIL